MRRAPLILGLTTAALAANGLRLRARANALHVLRSTAVPVEPSHRFVTAAGVHLDAATCRAASAYASRQGFEVLDLVPADLPTEACLDLLRQLDPRTYADDPSAPGASAGHALLVDEGVLARAGLKQTEDLDPVQMLRAARTLKRHAATRTSLVVAPDVRAVDADPDKRLALLRALYDKASGVALGVSAAELALLGLGVAAAPRWGAAAVVTHAAQPALALSGSPLVPRDRRWRGPARFGLACRDWMRTVRGRWAPEEPDPVEDRRDEYARLLERGTERFFEPRRDDCPLCGALDLVEHLRTPDLQQRKPGEFVLERCTGCEHIFQNPRLSVEGLDFYYKDFYDGLGEDALEAVFGAGGESYRDRTTMVADRAAPRRWMDVGAGHGHFCLIAGEILADTRFDGLDMSESIEEAERRRWVDRGYRGHFPDVAPELEARYDVVSMHHYLEHTREPLAELDAAQRVLEPGGLLLIELPDPESAYGRLLGRHWGPWFQPQHQHFLTVANLRAALEDRGFAVLEEHRGEAHQPVDLAFAAFMLLNRLAPPDLPWRPKPTTGERVRRGLALGACAPVIAGAMVVDRLLAPAIRREGLSNTYRLLAQSAVVSPTDDTVLDLTVLDTPTGVPAPA